MKIQKMFQDDINRVINGVIKVDQCDESTVQEIEEYVITRELKKHFITFFNYYGDAFQKKTDDIGVWISGFFGSGKSHMLKMLSYLLENRTIGGVKTVERFRRKFEDDPATFMMIDNATRGETETILFNIDIEGFSNKDNTAVLRVFAKMFYNHLGFYGEDLKVAKLEQFIDKQGKTEEFRRVFEEKNGATWVESRASYAFFEDDVVPTLMEVLGMSETAARHWFDGTETAEISIANLVSDIREYVDSKPDNFRLLFMVDEVGQYVGSDTDLLLNLQSLVEKIGSECKGKVWVVCTGQEAIDDIIKVRQDEFSRIQARFKTRLSLTSSSVDEVIQKRILSKTDEAQKRLENVYEENDSVLKNLFTFKDCVLDIKGYSGAVEFTEDFPFVPYQFIIMQKVFAEIRKHGNAGKHFSGAERSMLSGFQEAAQKVEDRDEYALVPLYLFYDTLHSFLDSTIRQVVERCQKAADNHDGLEQQDVNLLKLLYLLRYIDDIKANLDNLVILSADDIRTDKIELRAKVQASLDRLMSQNYIGRTGDTYNFLTDEEQDISREIKNTIIVDTGKIEAKIGDIIFGDIYPAKKFHYGKNDFVYDTMVDSQVIGSPTGGMCLQVLTAAVDASDKNVLRLMTDSKNRAIIALPDDISYYESLEHALKIRGYVSKKNINQAPKSVQDIIRSQQDEAARQEDTAREELKKAIVNADFYVDGEKLEIQAKDAVSKIDQAMEYLVSNVYKKLNLITRNAETDEDIREILNNDPQFPGLEANLDAAADMEEFLEIQYQKNFSTSMADIQKKYQNVPYGWREIDVAAVAAQLIAQQKVTIKYGGETIHADDRRLPDMLRKKSDVGKTVISRKISVSADNMKKAKDFMAEYFDVMSVPEDEEGLVSFIILKFEEQKKHYEELKQRYKDDSGEISTSKYPDYSKLKNALQKVDEVLSQRKDNIALVNRVLKLKDDLLNSKDDLQNLEGFFQNQVIVFDNAVKLEKSLSQELDYMQQEGEANEALNEIRLITQVQVKNPEIYRKIPKLNELMATVRAGHDRLLNDKRQELLEIVRQCLEAVHNAKYQHPKCSDFQKKADQYYVDMKKKIQEETNLLSLNGMKENLWSKKDDYVETLEALVKPEPPKPVHEDDEHGTSKPVDHKKKINKVYRQAAFPAKTLKSNEDVDAYVEEIRKRLKGELEGNDEIYISD